MSKEELITELEKAKARIRELEDAEAWYTEKIAELLVKYEGEQVRL